MVEDDLSFYERRTTEESLAAQRATSPGRASAHRLLAIEYAALARELRTRREREQRSTRPSGADRVACGGASAG